MPEKGDILVVSHDPALLKGALKNTVMPTPAGSAPLTILPPPQHHPQSFPGDPLALEFAGDGEIQGVDHIDTEIVRTGKRSGRE